MESPFGYKTQIFQGNCTPINAFGKQSTHKRKRQIRNQSTDLTKNKAIETISTFQKSYCILQSKFGTLIEKKVLFKKVIVSYYQNLAL